MTVYLLHLEQPLSSDHTAQHYLGSTDDLDQRLDDHKNHPDARFMQVAKERGIGFRLARTWDGGRQKERQLKNRKCAPRLCPICWNRLGIVAF